jgi:ParB family transcriptional regulator, chromosome partitioning protein
MAWEVRDIPPSVRRAAEAAAGAAGKPLGDWLADTVRAAVLAELGRLPARMRKSEQEPAAAPAKAPSVSTKRQLDLFPKPTAPAAARASNPPISASDIGPLTVPTEPFVMLPLTALRTGACRARRMGGGDLLPILAHSVAAEGVRRPIVVRRLAEDPATYEVIAGERRRLAAERAGQAAVPAVVVVADDAEALMLSLRENLGRADFSPLDEARAYLRLLTEYRVSPTVLARRLGRERAHLAFTLRLLGLPARVRQYLDSGQLGSADALALLDATDPEALAERLLRGAARRAGSSGP